MHNAHISGFDLNLLLVLHALLEERSVSRAGKRIGLSQSATSHALSRLRGALDDQLLIRDRHGVTPTARAEAMAAPLSDALDLLESTLFATTRFEPATAKRRFHIAATDYAELLLLPALSNALARSAPEVELWVHPFTDDALDALERGKLDLVVGVFDPKQPARGLRAARLLDDRLVCTVRAGHPLTRGKLTLARYESAQHALIAPRGKPGGAVDDALAAQGRKRHLSLVVPHFLAAPHVVAETDLVLTLAERVARHFALRLRLRILGLPVKVPSVRLSMLWHERQQKDRGHEWLRERVEQVARAVELAPQPPRGAGTARRQPQKRSG